MKWADKFAVSKLTDLALPGEDMSTGSLRGGIKLSLSGPKVLSLVRDYAALFMLVILGIILSIVSPAFLSVGNILNIVAEQAPAAIVAGAVTLVIIGGSFDLSTGSIIAVANIIAAEIVVHTGDVVLGLLAAPIAGLAMGILNGVVIRGLRIHSFLATLATSLVYSGLALLLTGGALIPVNLASFAVLGQGSVGHVGYSVFVLVGFVIFLMVLLNRTITGRHVFALGGNSEAAELSGVRVNLTCIITFAVSGLASGLAAAILVSRIASGQPTLGSDITITAIASVILGGTSIYGGKGAIWRTMVGVYLLALIANGFDLLSANQFYQDLVTGIVIVSAVGLAAAGRRR